MAVGKQRSTRDERERARVYQARQSFFTAQTRRRTRDNLIAGVVGGVLILAVTGGQIAYFTMGPGVPSPTPTPAPSDSAVPVPNPLESLLPQAPATPSATPSPSS